MLELDDETVEDATDDEVLLLFTDDFVAADEVFDDTTDDDVWLLDVSEEEEASLVMHIPEQSAPPFIGSQLSLGSSTQS